MIVTSAQYKTNDTGTNIYLFATIDSVEMTVPLDPSNRHYQAIQEWVAEGNTIQPAE